MTLTDFSERTNRPNLSDARPPRNKFHPAQECQTRGGKGEELRLQGQEGQELSPGAGASQRSRSDLCTISHSNGKTQTLKTVLKRPLVVHTSD